MEKLWEAILQAAYVDGGDAIANWRAHSAELARRTERLNACAFSTLHYETGLGTDLTVELPEGHFWAGGAETCVTSGVRFSANIPTEEVFTLPVKTGVNGVVYASRPLSLQGNLIEGFGFELKEGKIVRAFAEKGEEVLRNALERTNQKFIRRFNYLEEHTIKEGKNLKDMSLEEMDAIWNKAKKKGL